MTPDPTLLSRLLLQGAAMEFPFVTGTTLKPVGDRYFVAIWCEDREQILYQWCEPKDLDLVVQWMVTALWAMNGRLAEAV